MRCNAINVMAGLFFTVVISMAGCGGGGESTNGGGSSTEGIAKQGTWKGLYSGIAQTGAGPTRYSDLQVTGSSINKMYVDDRAFGVMDNTRPQAISLQKVNEFTGYAYQSSDGNIGFYFDNTGNHMGMIYGAGDVAVYQHDSMPRAIPKKEDINGVWNGSFFYKSNRDGKIYQSQTDVTCQYQVCTFDNGALVIDFAKPFYSDFLAEGKWYGRETNSGSRFLTTALMSGDLQYMIMPLCWSSGNNSFFDTCQAAVLSKTSPPLVNTANAGINQNVTIGTLVTLDGSGSKSVSGALTYRWRIVSKPAPSAATLSSTSTVNPTLTADIRGEYVFGLIVSNSGFESTESTVTITVSAPILTPPKLTSFKATGAVKTMVLTWDDPHFANLAYVEVFRNTADDIGTAQKVGTTSALTYTDTPPYEVPFSTDYYFWGRIVSIGDLNNDSMTGQFNATAGTSGRPLNSP